MDYSKWDWDNFKVIGSLDEFEDPRIKSKDQNNSKIWCCANKNCGYWISTRLVDWFSDFRCEECEGNNLMLINLNELT